MTESQTDSAAAESEMPTDDMKACSDDESGLVRKDSKDSSDKSTEKEKVVKLEPIFFKLNDGLDENAINEYRLKYREFRTGKAFGARGEIEKQTVVVSDPLETVIPPFVAKLASMLNNEMYSDYVSWSEDGKKVVVKKVAEFSSAILPKYFKHKNFTSFLRQLNMYGFHTARQGRNWREFRNELFTKEIPRLYCKIKRKANVGKTEEKNSVGSNDSSTGNKSKKRKKSTEASDDTNSKSQVELLQAQVKESTERITYLERQLERVQLVLAQVRKDVYKSSSLPVPTSDEMHQRNGKGRMKRMRTDASISSTFSDLDAITGVYGQDPRQRVPSGRSTNMYAQQSSSNHSGLGGNDYYYQNSAQDTSMFDIDDEGFFNYAH